MIVYTPQRADGFWGPITGSALPGMKRPSREADHCYVVLLLRISGAVSPLLHITLWRDQRMLCFNCSLQPLRLIVRSWLVVPTFATRRLHSCHHAWAPSGGRWSCGREISGNFA